MITALEAASHAEDKLSAAYALLGDAADWLRGMGFVDALDEIGQAKNRINRAKNEISAKVRS